MVNVTYDTCKSFFLFEITILTQANHNNSAGDLVVFAADGTPVVYNLGDISFMICATALVWIMIPGVGFFYSGLLRRKNALSMIYVSLASVAVVSFQVCPRPCCVNNHQTYSIL
jgi:hypothetical protein